jgi:hypothetical protein
MNVLEIVTLFARHTRHDLRRVHRNRWTTQ